MTEDLPLKEELSPSTEPIATSGLPEADKKRVMIGSAIGGGIFLGVLIAIIVLVSTEGSKPHPGPTPPAKVVRYPHYNPFFVESAVRENERLMKIVIANRRAELEGGQEPSGDPNNPIPIVVETLENAEPKLLEVIVVDIDEHLTRFIYFDPVFHRWHVPYFGNHSDPYAQASKYTHTQTGFALQNVDNNSFQWYYGGKVGKFLPLISTVGCRLQYFDKYIEFEAILERDYIYGMGERIETFHLKNDNYSLWNRYYPYAPGGDTENGMYGSHPFILNRLTNNQRDDFIGLFMRNSNAMLFSMWDNLHNGTIINYKMIGGSIDLFLFHTADPQYILRKYHSVIGRPYLPAVWSMGLHQAREHYTIKDFEEVIKGYQDNHIPVDALWADTMLNDNGRTFTVNTTNFGGIKELVAKMHDKVFGWDLQFVAIANPGLVKDNSYKYYTEAIAKECLIKSAVNFNNPFEGRIGYNTIVWLDFFIYNSTIIWAGGLHELHDNTLFDGIWISENEIQHDCYGECGAYSSSADEAPTIPNPFHNSSEFKYIQYRPTLDPLEIGTLHMAAYHYGDDFHRKQYFTHNLFGLQISQATFSALYGIFEDKRFFIASRSTWPGSGQYASHWLDGNYATWDSMAASIPGILNFNMFGIPHVGAPIGGFFGDCNPELLTRWYELGSYYPLALSYGSAYNNRKEAYTIPDYIPYIRNALAERYSLIRFMYTKMFESFAWGGAVVHPLFFDFTNDTNLYKREILDSVFMWSHTLYVIPSLAPHLESINAYVPNWKWYDLRTLEKVMDYNPGATEGHYMPFTQPLGYITVLIKGGSIIPYQHLTRESKIVNVKDLEKIPAKIIVAPDHDGKAMGSMVVDAEGIRPHPESRSNTYRHYTFTYMNQIFRINKLEGFDFHGSYEFDNFWELMILDVMGNHKVDFVCYMDMYLKKKELHFVKSPEGTALLIHDEMKMNLIPMFTVESIVWGSFEQHDFCKFQVHIADMSLSNNDRVLTGTLETSDPSAYRQIFNFEAAALTDYTVRLKIKLKDEKYQWEVPDVIEKEAEAVSATKSLDAVGFGTSVKGADFYFEMSEEDDPHDFLLTTRNQPFVYVKNFMQIKFLAAGRHVFGLGERVGKFELADGVYSIWNYDAMTEETGIPPGNNMYGSHPFYMLHTHNPRDFAGVFFLNSNPIDVRIKHIGMQTELDHVLSGGIIDLFFLGKGPAEQVLRQYHRLIGKPTPLPFWAFGYHQSRWGYRDYRHLEQIIGKFKERNLPLDAIWMDKDFMEAYKSFTIDRRNWQRLGQIVKELHADGKHFVAIVDAGIAIDLAYDVYTKGFDRGVYIKSSTTGEPLVGITWAGYSVWTDFQNSAAGDFWRECLDDFHKKLDFDGVWLDMNEPSNFCDGECPDKLTYHYYFFPLDYYDDLFYNPTHRPIEDNTISVEAIHSGDEKLHTEYNLHNLYGLQQSKHTALFFTSKLHRRPFVISSATFPGTGRYAAHWLGDNYASWQDLEHSIAGMLNFNMFGIPFVGADICGYRGNTTVNLCARWMQLGAFYPMMRNHNGPDTIGQEPYMDPVVEKTFKKAMQLRYSLVRYIYTEYMHAVLRGGSMVRPLVFIFPEDTETYTTIDNSFMLGPALRITPILEDGKDQVITYFPNANWYHLSAPKYEKIVSYNRTSHHGVNRTLTSTLNEGIINIHMRSGMIIPMQDVSESVFNIMDVQKLPINLIITPNHFHTAHGELVYDSESHENFKTDHQDIMLHLNGSVIICNMTSGQRQTSYNRTDRFVHKILIIDAEHYKETKNSKYDKGSNIGISMKPPVYDSQNHVLTLEPVDDHSMNILEVTKIYWSNTN